MESVLPWSFTDLDTYFRSPGPAGEAGRRREQRLQQWRDEWERQYRGRLVQWEGVVCDLRQDGSLLLRCAPDGLESDTRVKLAATLVENARSLRKEQRVAVIARLGSYDSTHFEIYDGRLVGVAPIPWWQELGLPAPARYKVVRVEDYSIAGRSRNSIRVIILDEWASWPEVHSALLEAARTHPADGVLVFGHRPGDDTDTFYTAGRLEWGRTGYGWTGDEYLGPAGEFDAGGAIPPEAQEFLRSMAEP